MLLIFKIKWISSLHNILFEVFKENNFGHVKYILQIDIVIPS